VGQVAEKDLPGLTALTEEQEIPRTGGQIAHIGLSFGRPIRITQPICYPSYASLSGCAQRPFPAQPDAQKSFEIMKTLAGSWQGSLTTVPEVTAMKGAVARLSLRVTSRRNASHA